MPRTPTVQDIEAAELGVIAARVELQRLQAMLQLIPELSHDRRGTLAVNLRVLHREVLRTIDVTRGGRVVPDTEIIMYHGPHGDDLHGDGTKEKPFRTLGKARQQIINWSRAVVMELPE